ncbi:hypothetical protein C8A00DRAFT_47462 [Chaetomidium leptoderma]|uniref:Uncharacterized protein n=1 Tax=Chaetomidium leptoderma TaxID=669021 RepID=A0AAN6ZSU3_9PEZI|nr:hypothetical protein C8A00DRAFT_47462 [Chaetomidium leptoderma]
MRALTRIRASQAPSHLRIQPTSASRRSFSSLRPLTLNHHPHPTTTTRPTLTISSSQHPRPQQSRPFSVLPLFESAIACSQTLLTTLHTTTLSPWYLTIPLFALTLNLFTRLPATVYSRGVAVRRQQLQPLMHAWTARVHTDLARGGKPGDTKQARTTLIGQGQGSAGWMRGFYKSNMAAMKARERRWGVQRWKDWVPALAVFPFWITGIEGLRRMCGAPRGLLGTIAFGHQGGAQAQAQAQAQTGQADVQEALASVSVADPSMMTGGCLWFPDLTVADPCHILPFALSAILVMNMLPKTQASLRVLLGLDSMPGAALGANMWRLRMQRGLLLVAMVIGPLTMDLPAALHLYWTSSAALTWAQTAAISRLMPMPTIVAPAKKGETILVMPTREETTKKP